MLAAIPICMFGRCYFLCHWVLDTIAGAFLGGCCVYFTEHFIGVENVGTSHFFQIVGVGAVVAIALHMTGILKIDLQGILQNVMPAAKPMS
jgi:hypothetical protein